MRGRGGLVVRAKPEVLARLLCAATHPAALALGTVEPFVRCCRHCTLYPAGNPASWRWPG